MDRIMELDEGTKIQLLAPIVRGRKGEHTKELDRARKSGYVRVRIDGITYDLSEEIKIEKNKKHTIEIVVPSYRQYRNFFFAYRGTCRG